MTTLRPNGQVNYINNDGSMTGPGLEYWDRIAKAVEALEDAPVTDTKITYAEAQILHKYGDVASVVDTAENIMKFGRDENIGTALQTIWSLPGNEVYVTTNAIDTMSSSDGADVQQMTVNGYTVVGTGVDAKFTRVIQEAILNGQNKVVLTTPLARVERVLNSNGVDLVGDIYVYQDGPITAGVPNTAAEIHATIPAGKNQTLKSALTIEDEEYGIVTGGIISINKKQVATVDFEYQVGLPGKVFLPQLLLGLSSSATTVFQFSFDPYLIIPPNSDARAVAVASIAGVSVDASIQIYYAKKVTP